MAGQGSKNRSVIDFWPGREGGWVDACTDLQRNAGGIFRMLKKSTGKVGSGCSSCWGEIFGILLESHKNTRMCTSCCSFLGRIGYALDPHKMKPT